MVQGCRQPFLFFYPRIAYSSTQEYPVRSKNLKSKIRESAVCIIGILDLILCPSHLPRVFFVNAFFLKKYFT
jgi:hypothetical protein